MDKFTKIITTLLVGLFLFVPLHKSALAQDSPEPVVPDSVPAEEYYIAEVVEVLSSQIVEAGGYEQLTQELKVKFLSGPRQGELINVEHGGVLAKTSTQEVRQGDKVVLVTTETAVGETFFIAEHYRLPQLGYVLAAFLAVVLILGRWKGLGSILGLGFSILVLVFYIVPKIVQGSDPLITSIFGALFVAGISIYLAHGFNKKTTVALFSTIITLIIAGLLAVGFVDFANLLGFGTEEAFYVQVLGSNTINLKGLLLGGIIIGALGVLDDITTSQAATVQEISRANPDLEIKQLYTRGIKVGREHISSLVNTLVFAYAGASFPLLVLFTINKNIPLWVTLNSELVAEEVVRTLVGSTALILAVPITTFLAAKYLKMQKSDKGLTKHQD